MSFSRKRSEIQVGLSGAVLKYIAITTMPADHIGAMLLEWIVYYRGNLEQVTMFMMSQWGGTLYWLWWMLRTVGRIAFPIYRSLLVERFLHTRDWHRYQLRMTAFVFISEVPFRLTMWNTWVGESSNMHVELAVELLVLRDLKQSKGLAQPRRATEMTAVIGGGCLATVFLKADYNMDGILIISLFYLLRGKRTVQVMSGGILSLLESWNVCYEAGILSAAPLYFYNGKRGQAPQKYALYWFYLLHLMILFFIRLYVVGVPLG